jgi:hypothetical protein
VTFRIDGSGSYDPDGTGLVYSWSVDSTDIELTSHTESSRPFGVLGGGLTEMVFSPITYTAEVEVTVTDCDGLLDVDALTVEVVCSANILGSAQIYD